MFRARKAVFRLLAMTLLWVGSAAAERAGPLFEVSVNKYMMGTRVETTARHGDILACKSALIAAFHLQDFAVATSGDYERFKVVDGRRYHHIIDPRSGYPGRLSQSATVLAPSSEEADMLATYVFLLGADAALQQAAEIPFLIVDAGGVPRYNEAFGQRVDVEMIDPAK
ncbi:MAG: FAD:protein FMN transferase [bacterium]|nr:FAD:protein FMN transferase [bacterium]